MMKLVLLVCLAALCCSVVNADGNRWGWRKGGGGRYSNKQYQDKFLSWQRKYNKTYTADEFLDKFANFKGHMDYVEEQNALNLTYTVGLNQWSGLSPEEFQKLMLITIPDIQPRSDEELYEGHHVFRAATVDWRTSGVVNPIKDQGRCGACWTFAAAGAIESAWALKTGNLVSLSEQQLLDCTNTGMTCNGGDPLYAINYIKNAGGHDTEASYPYKAAKGTCSHNDANSAATVSGATLVTPNSESALLSAVSQQPVVICMNAGLASFQSYRSGTFSDSTCSGANSALNHAVVAIGYGTDASGDYWLMRNSWGTSWGMSGYFQIARNANNMCGVATRALFPSTAGTGANVTPAPATTTTSPPTTTPTTTTPRPPTTTTRPPTTTTLPPTTTTTPAPTTTTPAPTTTRATTTLAPTTTRATTTLAPTTTRATTTPAPTTTRATTTPAPTTTSAPKTALGDIFRNALATGWTASGGTINTCAAAVTGACGISFAVKLSQSVIFAHATASTSGVSKFKFSVKSASNTVLTVTIGNYAGTVQITPGWTSITAPLSSFGNPASLSGVLFKASNANTLYFDEVYFA